MDDFCRLVVRLKTSIGVTCVLFSIKGTKRNRKMLILGKSMMWMTTAEGSKYGLISGRYRELQYQMWEGLIVTWHPLVGWVSVSDWSFIAAEEAEPFSNWLRPLQLPPQLTNVGLCETHKTDPHKAIFGPFFRWIAQPYTNVKQHSVWLRLGVKNRASWPLHHREADLAYQTFGLV